MIPTLQPWLDTYLPGNSVGNLLWFAGLLLVGLPAHRLLGRLVSRWFYQFLNREIGGVSLTAVAQLMSPPINALILLTVVFVAFDQLTIPAVWHWRPATELGPLRLLLWVYQTVWMSVATWGVVQIVRSISLIFKRQAELTGDKFDDQLVPFLRDLAIVLVLFLGALLTLGAVFSVNVLALVTSLGIGGLAVALAARETLENLFASFTLLLDRPFLLGDSILLGNLEGDVERIGIRSTHLRTDDGSLLVVPNRLMTSQTLENQTQRRVRRANFLLHLDLDTPTDRLQLLLADMRQLLLSHELTASEPSVVHLESIGERAIQVRVIYFCRTPKIRDFRAAREQVNLPLLALIHQHGVRFAANVPGFILRESD